MTRADSAALDWDGLLASFVEVGLNPDHFWQLTPREIYTRIKGALAGIKRQRNDLLWQAWHGAYLTAYAPSEASKFPKLSKLLSDQTAPTPAQAWQEQLAIARHWAAKGET